MSLASLVLNPVRYLFSASLNTVFQPDVRGNPVVINADRQSDDGSYQSKEQRRGFSPQYAVPLKRPHNDFEAQRLYNHIRTVSWYLDAIPFVGRQLPFNIGIDSIIGVIPGVGDYIGLLLSLYALLLSCLFGLPLEVIGFMIFNIILDCVLGLVPFVGDALDVAFKANLRNLRLLEDHLQMKRGACGAGRFNLTFPPTTRFLPAESPQAARPMPNINESNSRGWRRTSARASPQSSRWRNRAADFYRGATEFGAEEKAPSVAPNHDVDYKDGPEEVFSTMRFDPRGISVENLLPQGLKSKAEDMEVKSSEETLCCQIPLMERHIDRIIKSMMAMRATYTGWCNQIYNSDASLLERLREDLGQSLSCQKEAPRRVRLALGRTGQISVTSFPTAPSHGNAPLPVVRIDTLPISRDIEAALLLNKTSSRSIYDRARERVGATLGVKPAPSWSVLEHCEPCFDALLYCSVGGKTYFTESSIANIILEVPIEYGQRSTFFTPLAERGKTLFLPGLMRAQLLERNLIQERAMEIDWVKEQMQTEGVRLYLCNALRGVFEVKLEL